jgi:hypothetical protein
MINREIYTTLTQKALPYLDFIPAVIVGIAVIAVFLLPWFGAAFGVLGYLLYLLVFTLLVWAIAAMMGRKFTYGELYRLGFYGLTPAIIVGFVSHWLDLQFSMLFTLIFLITMGIVVHAFPKGDVPKTVSMKKSTKKR